jgi:glyoxylase-like metal-dependent hydrolase (beta-lactamase superfamily II)
MRSVDELVAGIRRVTLPLPTRPGHVHAYLLPSSEGWILVDTGVGLPEAKDLWAAELERAGGRVAAIFVTHFHPDHVGAAADLHELTGAPVYQGALDYAQCELVWGNPAWSERLVEWFRLQGAPDEVTAELVGQSSLYRPFVRYQRDPVLLEPGERLDGWELVAAAGHADGQLCLLKDGVLVAADHVLARITPTVGLWPASRADPLGDYLEALERTAALAPRIALPGHGDPIEDPVARARELQEHHRLRLEETVAALRTEPQTGYELSFALFGADLKPAGRRFAVAETLSHLERLVRAGAAARGEDSGTVTYTAA